MREARAIYCVCPKCLAKADLDANGGNPSPCPDCGEGRENVMFVPRGVLPVTTGRQDGHGVGRLRGMGQPGTDRCDEEHPRRMPLRHCREAPMKTITIIRKLTRCVYCLCDKFTRSEPGTARCADCGRPWKARSHQKRPNGTLHVTNGVPPWPFGAMCRECLGPMGDLDRGTKCSDCGCENVLCHEDYGRLGGILTSWNMPEGTLRVTTGKRE